MHNVSKGGRMQANKQHCIKNLFKVALTLRPRLWHSHYHRIVFSSIPEVRSCLSELNSRRHNHHLFWLALSPHHCGLPKHSNTLPSSPPTPPLSLTVQKLSWTVFSFWCKKKFTLIWPPQFSFPTALLVRSPIEISIKNIVLIPHYKFVCWANNWLVEWVQFKFVINGKFY